MPIRITSAKKTINAYQTQNCNKTVIPIVTPTNYCDVAGSATGIGSRTITKTGYITVKVGRTTKRKWGTTVTVTPYAMFDVVFGCSGATMAKATITISAGAQCHGGGCNSSYYPLTLYFLPSGNATVTGYMAQNYTGLWWYQTQASYSAVNNTLTLTTGAYTATAIPTGTVGIRNVISWTLNNGCAVQEAAAL